MPKTCILKLNFVSCPKGLMFDVLEGAGSGGRSPLLIYIHFGVDVPTKPSVLKNRMPKTCILIWNFVSCPKGLMSTYFRAGGQGLALTGLYAGKDTATCCLKRTRTCACSASVGFYARAPILDRSDLPEGLRIHWATQKPAT